MIDDVDKLMNGEKADMVFTDPPYDLLDLSYLIQALHSPKYAVCSESTIVNCLLYRT